MTTIAAGRVDLPVPDRVVPSDIESRLALLVASMLPTDEGRPYREDGAWHLFLSPAVAEVVATVVLGKASGPAVDLAWALVALELEGGTAQDVLGDLAADGTGEPTLRLSDEDARELALTGSLVETMPPAARRGSFRTVVRRRRVLAESLDAPRVAALLKVTESRVRQRAGARTLFSVKAGNTLRFPAFQFPDGVEPPGWDDVAPHFPEGAHPVAVERFMTSPHTELEVAGEETSPIEWLLTGGASARVAELVDDAYAFA